MLLFSSNTKKTNQKLRLKSLEDNALKNRKEIESKLKEAKIVDQQLDQVLLDTKKLTASIQQRLSNRLKITQKTIKTICSNMSQGVVILDYLGHAVEINNSFKRMFAINTVDFNFHKICNTLNPLTIDGKKFSTNLNFEIESDIAFKSKTFDLILQPKIELEVHPKDKEPFKCILEISVLDNNPETMEDVSFIIFCKRL